MMRILTLLVCLGTVFAQEPSTTGGGEKITQVVEQDQKTMEQDVEKAEQSEQVMADKAAAATQEAGQSQAKADEAAATVSHDERDQTLKEDEASEAKQIAEDDKTEAEDMTNSVDKSNQMTKVQDEEAKADKLSAEAKAIDPKLTQDKNASYASRKNEEVAEQDARDAQRNAKRTQDLSAAEQEEAEAAGAANSAVTQLTNLASSLNNQDENAGRATELSDGIIKQASSDLEQARAKRQDEITEDEDMIKQLQSNITERSETMSHDEVREIRRQEHKLRKRIHEAKHALSHLDERYEYKAMKDGCKHARRTMADKLRGLYKEAMSSTDTWRRQSRKIRRLNRTSTEKSQEDVNVIMAAEEMRGQAKNLYDASSELVDVLFDRVCQRVDARAESLKFEAKQKEKMDKALKHAQKRSEKANERMNEAREAAQELKRAKEDEESALQTYQSQMKDFDLYISGLNTTHHNPSFVKAMAQKFKTSAQTDFKQKRTQVQQSLVENVANLQKLAQDKDDIMVTQNRTQVRKLEEDWKGTVEAIRDDKEKLSDLSEESEQEEMDDALRFAEKQERRRCEQHEDAIKKAIEDYRHAAKRVKDGKKASGLDDSFWEGDYENAERHWDQLEKKLHKKVDLGKEIIRDLYESVEDDMTETTATTAAPGWSMLAATQGQRGYLRGVDVPQGSQAMSAVCFLMAGLLVAAFSFSRSRRSMPRVSQEPMLG